MLKEVCPQMQELAARAFDHAPTPMAVFDAAGRLAADNAAWRTATSRTGTGHTLPGALEGLGLDHDDALRLAQELMQGCYLEEGPEVPVDLPDGRSRIWQFGANPLPEGGLTVAAIDITERRQEEEEAERMAYLDALTGLPNRRLFDDRLAQAIERMKRGHAGFAVHFLDLDHFKQVNDTLGHAAGDRLLRHVARRLATSVRRSDTVARFGGDEFGIIQTEIQGEAAAEALARKLVGALARPFRIGEDDIQSGASIGVALVLDPQKADASRVMRAADAALYRVKQGGRGTYQFAAPAEWEA